MTALPYRVLTAGANTVEWLTLRQDGVGASESAAVLGDSAWGTARSVYDQKVGPVVDETTDLMELGHLAEPLIVAFIEGHPERFNWIGEILPAEGLLQSLEWPWLLGTLDRMVRCPDGTLVPLELKSINDYTASEWKVGGRPDDEPVPDANSFGVRYEVPRKYVVQVQQQMAVQGAPFAYVGVWLGKSRVEIIRVDRDDQYIEEFLVGKVGDFWNYHVVPRVPPPINLNDDLWKAFPGDPSLRPYVADEDLVDEIGLWRIYTTDQRDARAAVKQHEFNILDRIGDHTEVVDPVSRKVIHSLRGQRSARITDLALLEKNYPDAYAECVSEGSWFRQHRATKVKL